MSIVLLIFQHLNLFTPGQFTNAGNDWYFENRVADPPDADAWIGWVSGASSKSLLTIPA